MTKVVINRCYGSFKLSDKAINRYAEVAGVEVVPRVFDRADPFLVQVVEELGEESWGDYAKLGIVEIPDDVKWEVEEYDGKEWVAEVHRRWY